MLTPDMEFGVLMQGMGLQFVIRETAQELQVHVLVPAHTNLFC